MVSQAIMLALVGVPGIYFHSLFGSRSWPEGVGQTGRFRSINRQKLQRMELEAELAVPHSIRYQVFYAYTYLLRQRAAHPAFHPYGRQQVIQGHDALFTLVRTSPDEDEELLCIHNVSNSAHPFQANLEALSIRHAGALHDVISGKTYRVKDNNLTLTVGPHQVLWLKGEG